MTHISRREFDHAATRSHAVAHSDADIFVMMTMDAYPKDTHLIENLVKALVPDNVAVSYARQLANPDAGMIEQFTRNYNYPDTSCMKSKRISKSWGSRPSSARMSVRPIREISLTGLGVSGSCDIQ